MLPPMTRMLWLVFVAMVMFTIGVGVFLAANDRVEHVLGAACVLGAIAVIVANVANGKAHHDPRTDELGKRVDALSDRVSRIEGWRDYSSVRGGDPRP